MSPIFSWIFNKIEGVVWIIHKEVGLLQQKIKQDERGNIGKNIREIRVAKGIGQTELARSLDLQGIPITREGLIKIERGIQHVQVEQLRAIKDELKTTYDELLK